MRCDRLDQKRMNVIYSKKLSLIFGITL